jgi:membrane protein required for colicin V production
MLNGFDYVILGVIALSALIGVVRGFVREVFSLISWILAFWLAFTYASAASVYFETYLDASTLRIAAAFTILFVGSLIVLTITSFLIYRLLSISGVSGSDRMLGAVFGLCRAAAIVAGFMLVAGVTPLPEEPWWRESMLMKYFQPLTLLLRDLLPSAVSEQLIAK